MEHVWEPGPAKFTVPINPLSLRFNHDKSVADFLKFSPQKLLCQPFMSATASSPQAQAQEMAPCQRHTKELEPEHRPHDIPSRMSSHVCVSGQLMVQWDFAERRWWDIRKARSPYAQAKSILPAKPARKPPSPTESMAKLLRSCATEANKRELLVNHGWTGYQAQKKEEWVVWWYLSDTIWAWESDLFGAEEARLGEREWPVESAEHVFVPGQRTVSGQLAAVRAQRPGTRECQQRKKESKCL
ncbi:unnamed protein product [Symbiodinium sp. CCMP2592]|nr:unnamed protein product [Symbiodinium sp. CCMP2592]